MSWLIADFSFLIYFPSVFQYQPAFQNKVETWLSEFVEQLGDVEPVHRKVVSEGLTKINDTTARGPNGTIISMVTTEPIAINQAGDRWVWGLPGFPLNRRSWKFLSTQLMALIRDPVFEDFSWDGKLEYLDKENNPQLITFSITMDVDQNWMYEIYTSYNIFINDEQMLEEKRLRRFLSSEDVEPV